MDIRETINILNANTDCHTRYKVPDDCEQDRLFDAMFKEVWKQKWQRRTRRDAIYGDIVSDLRNGTFLQKDEDAYEKYRLEGIEKIKQENDPIKKVEIFEEYAEELYDNLRLWDLMEFTSNQTRVLIAIEVCGKLFENNKLSLTEIHEVVPWQNISDIYGLSIMLGHEVKITDEELEQIKEEYMKTGEPALLKDRFGEPTHKKGVSLASLFGKGDEDE